ncbi:arsenate reductase ArsC [uncultured Parasphingorhabdus sp.]|uniref:arsenate reductase ArsC n=1 Tax=uncultured Parasphingorhabdus sp. TaxID=2709694 RepID=UPI0030DCAF0A|tara:strand:- start:9220 stop:9732 length:513 start_codon:yes stop_codon:yes gene_type:complete
MSGKTYNVLFLCTGNSARSILGEALLNRDGAGRFRAYSAGSFPKGEAHPMALEILEQLEFDTGGLRSKSWDEFSAPDAPRMDVIITVCDNAAGETCPIWPGHPVTAHWGIEDPAAVEGDGQREAFQTALRYMRNRISLLLNLPIDALDALSLKTRLAAIGADESARERNI